MLVLTRQMGSVTTIKVGEKELNVHLWKDKRGNYKLGFEGDKGFVIERDDLVKSDQKSDGERVLLQ